MRKYLISAAALALMAIPALAQPDGQHGKAGLGQPEAPRAAPAERAAPAARAPQAAPGAAQNRGGGDRGARGGDRGGRAPQAPVAQPAPQAAPAAQSQTRGNGFGGNRDGRGANQNAGRNDRGNVTPRGFDNRPGNNGFGNRPGNNGAAGRPGYGGSRHDFSSFRNYHQNFSAQRHFRGPSYRRPAGWYQHRWTFGEILPSLFWSQDYWLNDYTDYDLPPPPYGAVWVRDGNDALLIDRDSGEIITVEYDVFY